MEYAEAPAIAETINVDARQMRETDERLARGRSLPLVIAAVLLSPCGGAASSSSCVKRPLRFFLKRGGRAATAAASRTRRGWRRAGMSAADRECVARSAGETTGEVCCCHRWQRAQKG